MEGLGSRMGRASSRYGSTAVFNGPVRKWKKKWVQVSSSPSPRSVVSNHGSSQSQSDGSGSLLLRRWTPVSSGGSGGQATEEEPRRRKFRYTPIAVLDEHTKVSVKKIDEEPKRSDVSTSWLTIKKDHKKSNINDVSKEVIQDPKRSRLDLELDLEEQGDDDSN